LSTQSLKMFANTGAIISIIHLMMIGGTTNFTTIYVLKFH